MAPVHNSGINSQPLIARDVRQLQTEMNLTRHELNALLGLRPDVQLHLIGTTEIKPLSKDEFDRAITALPHRRADLLALQAGYQSQEELLRRAILAQFPTLSAGVDLERDPVEGVNAFGPEVSLSLPIFNRNQGQIAIERATRAVMWQQYQEQLDSARIRRRRGMDSGRFDSQYFVGSFSSFGHSTSSHCSGCGSLRQISR